MDRQTSSLCHFARVLFVLMFRSNVCANVFVVFIARVGLCLCLNQGTSVSVSMSEPGVGLCLCLSEGRFVSMSEPG